MGNLIVTNLHHGTRRSPIPPPKTDDALSLSGKSECLNREGSPTFTTRLRKPRSGKFPTVSPASKSRNFLEPNTSPGPQWLGLATS